MLDAKFFSAISERESSTDALAEVVGAAREAMGGKIDIVFVFFTAHFSDSAPAMAETLWLELDAQSLVGCSAEGVIGGDREIERTPGLALLVGRAPGVRVHPFQISGQKAWREVLTDGDALRSRFGVTAESRAIIGFGDPFTTPVTQLLPALDAAAPGVPLVGGMASSAHQPGENVLLRNDQTYQQGLVGVTLSGDIDVETIVSQGCRPIGRPMIITKSHDNIVEQLSGRPALQVLQEMVTEMGEAEREHLAGGLFLGRAISEFKERFGRGDFLVRNVMGMDEESGALAVGEMIKTGQTVQFHLRDAGTADEDLSLLLEMQKLDEGPAGGLLFSCNGRGTRMFEQPSHDIKAAQRAMPRTPVAGFFAAGELGPIGEHNFIHGHTASFALFRPRTGATPT
jgi:small ligand-binding sensory domain FIST